MVKYLVLVNVTVIQLLTYAGALCTRNNTDGNKLVIFSGIALYYVILI